MNKDLWEIYKNSDKGRKCIEIFKPDVENIEESIRSILEFSEKWENKTSLDAWLFYDFLFNVNLHSSNLLPENGEWTREKYCRLIEEYQLIEATANERGEIKFYDDNKSILISKDKFRLKAARVPQMSLFMYYSYSFFKPLLLPGHFDIIQCNCDALGIELPPIPRSRDYKAYLMYYYDICSIWNEFQDENQLTDAELCACIYDYACLLQNQKKPLDLPDPINVWLTGASVCDFEFLDNAVQNPDMKMNHIWACNERTVRGDIVIIYCKSPRSCIHSIWRADSGGKFNPFDYYHCRTTVCNGIEVPPISIHDLKNDTYFSEIPIVRKNLQGVNGVELTATDYAELLRIIREKGGDTSQYPNLFEVKVIDFGKLTVEKDVEEKILIPFLKQLGYSEDDWSRQLSQKAGHGLKAIPDFVFFPKGEKHFSSAPMVVEVKFDMSSAKERQNAFSQVYSYARLLRSSVMGICDRERLVLYSLDKDGRANRNAPLFEEHWFSIYGNSQVSARLKQLIGREVILNGSKIASLNKNI